MTCALSPGFRLDAGRHLLPGWLAVGTALENFINRKPRVNLKVLREMHRDWPFFRSTLSNIEMTLAKADFQIARQYAARTADRELGARVFHLLEEEYQRTCRVVLRITGEQHLARRNSGFATLDCRAQSLR